MKLVNFETFNKMPAGTIFAPYGPFECYQINKTNYDLLDVVKIIKEENV